MNRADRNPNDRKFEELILFICKRSMADPKFGATKLNKILFYSDFLAFLELGEAITWHHYQRLDNGPAPIALLPVLNRMEEARKIGRSELLYHGKIQKRTVALRDPDLGVFTAQEIAIVTDVIETLWDKNASEVSELSHLFLGWKAADYKEEIPYGVALVRTPEPTEHNRQRGIELEPLAKEMLASINE